VFTVYCRFNDIAASVRRICVQLSQELIVNHPELVRDIAGKCQLVVEKHV